MVKTLLANIRIFCRNTCASCLENVKGIGLLMVSGDRLTVSDAEVLIRQVVLRIYCKVFPGDIERHIVFGK